MTAATETEKNAARRLAAWRSAWALVLRRLGRSGLLRSGLVLLGRRAHGERWYRASGRRMGVLGGFSFQGFGGAVQAGHAEGVTGPGGVAEACVPNQVQHARGSGKTLDGGGKVRVGFGVRDECLRCGGGFS